MTKLAEYVEHEAHFCSKLKKTKNNPASEEASSLKFSITV